MAALTKGLATEYSPETQPATLECAVLSYGLGCVLRATWCKAAMLAKKRAQNKLICANNGEKNLVHG
jgi:hypothetical protein